MTMLNYTQIRFVSPTRKRTL